MRPVTRRLLVPVAAAALLVGTLGWLLWPRGQPETAVLSADTEEHVVRLTLQPPQVGPATWTVEVTDTRHRPVELRSVSVDPAMPGMGHAIAPKQAVREAPGRYRVERATLPMSGAWELTVTMRGSAGTDTAVFPVVISS